MAREAGHGQLSPGNNLFDTSETSAKSVITLVVAISRRPSPRYKLTMTTRFLGFKKALVVFNRRHQFHDRLITVRLLSSVDTAEPIVSSSERLTTARQQKPRPVFPWVHSNEMIPRLTRGTEESRYDIGLNETGERLIYNMLLDEGGNGGLIRIIFRSLWGGNEKLQDLAESAAWAFTQGVAAIMNNTYNVPLDNLCNDKAEVRFLYPSSLRDSSNADAVEGNCNGKSEPDAFKIHSIVAEPLRNLYRVAHQSGRDQLRIRLEMVPNGPIRLRNLFCIPTISRSLTSRNRSVHEKLRTIAEYLRDGSVPFRLVNEVMHDALNDKIENGNGGPVTFDTTVEMQVLMRFDEIFCVTDAETGVVLQGSPEGESVYHLARFETTVETEVDFRGTLFLPRVSSKRIDGWKLVDIDDLLGYKTWYHGEESR